MKYYLTEAVKPNRMIAGDFDDLIKDVKDGGGYKINTYDTMDYVTFSVTIFYKNRIMEICEFDSKDWRDHYINQQDRYWDNYISKPDEIRLLKATKLKER